MAIQHINQPRASRLLMSDPYLKRSIERIMKRDNDVPRKVADEYPQRGEDIYKQVRFKVINGNRSEYIIDSPLTTQTKLDHMLIVLAYWGTNTTREEVTRKAINHLLQMNPISKIVLVEGGVDGNYRFRDVVDRGINYLPIDLQQDCYRNLFVKEILWNHGVKKMLEADQTITKICYLDADCVFVDRYALSDVDRALDQYDVISPMRSAYYADKDKWHDRYGLLNTIGYCVAIKASRYGWQGFGLALTVQFLKQYFDYELPCSSLGFGDCIFWWLLTSKGVMKTFRRIPYDKKMLEQYILPNTVRIGYANTIMQHLYHGTVVDRQYLVRCRLVQRSIRTPFSDLGRLDNDMLCWNTTPEVKVLRTCLEWLLIFNRKSLKLSTEQDADQLYDWVTGISKCPPKKFRNTPFAVDNNEFPTHGVSRPMPNKISEI